MNKKKEEEEEGEADLLKRRELEWVEKREEREGRKKNERLLSWLLKYDNTYMNRTLLMISREREKRKK